MLQWDRRQRQSVVQSGDVFNDYGGSDNGAIHQIFTYNTRGELTAAPTYLGATATDQSQPLSARFHEYDYDGIGNRKWSNTSGNSALRDNYNVNELNQYVGKENHTLAVGGTVADDANIKVAAGSTAAALAGRHGRHWGDNIVVDNALTAWQGDLTLYAVNPTTNKKMTDVRTAFLPAASQTMQYDQDGNLTNDGVWFYEWDAENRLIAMQATSAAVAGGVPAQRLEFKYDYLHRRIEKLVRGGWNGSVFTTVTAQKRFLYDGWSLIAEYSVSGSTLTLAKSYTWGLDIAKSLADAGGVGALLQIHDYSGSGKDYLPSYDGNGNIAALFDADASSSGTACVAAYEYSPYGESLRCEGTYAKENPFRFSTKFTDDETGLVYYGRRYYSPSQGRFLGRDPKEEKGGLHLYAFCRNNSINLWDVLGMAEGTRTGPIIFPGDPMGDQLSAIMRAQTRASALAWDLTQERFGALADAAADAASGGGRSAGKVNMPDLFQIMTGSMPILDTSTAMGRRLDRAREQSGLDSVLMMALAYMENEDLNPALKNADPKSSATGLFQITTGTADYLAKTISPGFGADFQGDWRKDTSMSITGAALILLDKIASAGGNLAQGLQNYRGVPTGTTYSTKVIAMRDAINAYAAENLEGDLSKATQADWGKITATLVSIKHPPGRGRDDDDE